MIYLTPIEQSHLVYYEVDESEADAEFIGAVKDLAEDAFTVFNDDKVIGYAQCVTCEEAFAYVYIFKALRRQGFGSAAISAAEQMLQEKGAKRIVCCCDNSDERVKNFLQALGYRIDFPSCYMEYQGAPLATGSQKAVFRQYRPEEYEKIHAFDAEAFHRMRLSTPWFPDSTPEAPTEEMKAEWAETAQERFVYELDAEAIGYAHLEDEEIDSISIAPAFQGKGYGRAFLTEIVDYLITDKEETTIGLWCVAGNEAAHSLYLSVGFKETCCSMYLSKETV